MTQGHHVAVFIACAVLLSSLSVQAQEKKTFRDLPTAPKVQTKKRKRAVEAKGPALGSNQFTGKKPRQLLEGKWKESFARLKRLIKATPDSHPDKPDFLYRMSEMFWERASGVEIQAFADEEACQARARGNVAAEERCTDERERGTRQSEKYRDQAIKIYKHIVRGFPSYRKLDGVLFALAFNFQRKQKPEQAKKIYRTLLQRFPDSRHIPPSLLNFGEILFDAGDVRSAEKMYSKIVRSYKSSSVYGYARYKLGWCNFNLSRFQEAMGDFLAVLKYSRTQKGQGRNRITLEKEALKDLVRTYVRLTGDARLSKKQRRNLAKPRRAIKFFRKNAPDRYMDLLEKLAQLYSDTGQFKVSNQLYAGLIKLKKRSYRVVSYQRAIADNTRNIGNQVETVKELRRLLSIWAKVKNASDADPKRVAKDRKGIEEILRSMAVTYHRQANKTKSDEDYGIAYNLYADYLKTFPQNDNAYSMNFYYAELLYTRQKWKDSAARYEAVVRMKGDGEFSRDAAHGAVLAYKELLNLKLQNSKKTAAELEEAEKPEPKKISDAHQRFIEACGVYARYIKGTQFEVDLNYDVARIYFDFNHFDKSTPKFRQISEKSPNHRLSIYAANLLLDSFVLQKNYSDLNAQAETYLRIYPQERDEVFHERLITIKQNATFNQCKEIEGRTEYVQAARCFRRYARDFGDSDYASKALYNAAVNYQKKRMINQSNKMLLRLVNQKQDEGLAKKSNLQVARNYQAMAVYGNAAKAYEFYAKRFPSDKKAPEALQNAAFFRMGLGNLDKAIKNYQAYMKRVGKTDEKKAAEVYFSIGRIYEKQEKWPQVVRHYRKFLKRFGRVAKTDLVIGAHTRIGNAYWKQAEPYIKRKRKKWRRFDEFNKPAQRAYAAAYKTFTSLKGKQLAELTTGVAAAAEARFRMGEDVYYTVKYRTRLKAKNYRNLKKFLKTMTERIVARGKVISSARAIYDEVIKLKSPNWAIAAIARQGEMLETFSDAIYNYPAPKAFSEDQAEAFKGTMTDRAEVFRQQAIEAFQLCLRKAQELRWFNEWSDNAGKRLAQLAPGKFRDNAELRASPNVFGEPHVRRSLITRVGAEEE